MNFAVLMNVFLKSFDCMSNSDVLDSAFIHFHKINSFIYVPMFLQNIFAIFGYLKLFVESLISEKGK